MPCLHLGQSADDVVEHQRDLPADDVGYRQGHPLVGDVHDFDARHAPEQLGRQVDDGADAA